MAMLLCEVISSAASFVGEACVSLFTPVFNKQSGTQALKSCVPEETGMILIGISQLKHVSL